MENFLVSVRCIAPVLLVMCLGIVIRARRLVPEEVFGHLSTMCFHFLLPFQLFFNIYDARLEGAFSPRLLVFLEAGILIWFLANYALFAAVEPDRRARGAYIQNAFRSNIAVVGVSLAQSMMGDGPGGGDHLPVFLSDHAVLDLRTEAAGLDVILFLERKSIKKSFIAPLKLLRFQGFSPVSILYF